MPQIEAQGSGTADAAGERPGQFAIQKIYVKDVSFETPNSPRVFQGKWQPKVNMDLQSSAAALDVPFYEVVLSLTVTVSCEQETVYLVEVQQAGIFQLQDLPEPALKRALGAVCPNILFPFAREMVADLVTRGGFPQLLLAPVNFEALHDRQQAAGQAPAVPNR